MCENKIEIYFKCFDRTDLVREKSGGGTAFEIEKFHARA